jgi:hypothetical protein
MNLIGVAVIFCGSGFPAALIEDEKPLPRWEGAVRPNPLTKKPFPRGNGSENCHS